MKEKKIICKRCGEEFLFTVGEQKWYEDHNLNEPKNCSNCRKIRHEEKKKSLEQNKKLEVN